MLKDKILSREALVGVIGLGYVGLPLAVETARSGFTVRGFDINTQKVSLINSGEYRLEDLDPEELRRLVNLRKLEACSDFAHLGESDIVFVCVPTPLTETKEPDISAIVSATGEIEKRLRREQLIVLESTTYPGTTEEEVLPVLTKKGFRVGEDFYLAYSPERVDPGNKQFGIRNTPRIVGGVTPTCAENARSFYEQIVDRVKVVSSVKVAETTKLLENIFRGVNIALVNELMMLCDRMKINIWEVIGAASTKPFGYMPFYPGPGMGGHCIPIDPFYLSWKAREYDFHTEFIELAGKINENVPHYVVQKITDALNEQKKSINGSRILIIGVAYKKNVADTRSSPALKIIELLSQRKAIVSYHDPLVERIEVQGKTFLSKPLTQDETASSDCVVIIADHDHIDYGMIVQNALSVVDTRNALSKFSAKHILKI